MSKGYYTQIRPSSFLMFIAWHTHALRRILCIWCLFYFIHLLKFRYVSYTQTQLQTRANSKQRHVSCFISTGRVLNPQWNVEHQPSFTDTRLVAAKAKGSWWTMALEVLSSMPKSQVCPGNFFVCNVCDVFLFFFFGAERLDGTFK